MSKPLDVEDLDAQDLTELLTELNGASTKVKNPAKGRIDLLAVLAEQNKHIVVNDDGNFEILDKPKAPKAKAKPAPVEEDEDEAPAPKAKAKPAPVEEDEEEDEDEDEDEDEEEVVAAKPKAKAKPAPAKAKAKPAPVEDEDEEVEAKPKAKRGSGLIPKEPSIKDGKITILMKDKAFKAESIRATLWGVMKKAKTVASYFEAADQTEAASTGRGFLNVAVKEGWISVT